MNGSVVEGFITEVINSKIEGRGDEGKLKEDETDKQTVVEKMYV